MEEKVIINEKIDGLLKEFEEVLKVAMPVKANADLVNQVIYSTLKDETKEKVIEELLETSKEALNWKTELAKEINSEDSLEDTQRIVLPRGHRSISKQQNQRSKT